MNYSKISVCQGTPIVSLSRKENDRWMNDLHHYAEDALEYYHNTFGFYPFPFLLLLAGEVDCGGGYPQNPGVIVIHQKPFAAKEKTASWQWIVAHELGHMYWGYSVFDAQPRKGSMLGWMTKGIGLYWDKQYLKDRGIHSHIHEQMIEKFLTASKNGYDRSFTLSEKLKKDLGFDYNEVIDHGRSLYVVEKLAQKLGKVEFEQLTKRLLIAYKGKRFGFDDLLQNLGDSEVKVYVQSLVD